MHLRCQGQGQPTVIFEAGMGDTLDTWMSIQPVVAKETRTCSYDRAGLGESASAPEPRLIGEMVDDLHRLLEIAGIVGPYIMVGHSFGAQIVRLFASRHTNDVVGMILIDPSHEDKYVRFEKVLTEDLIIRQNNYVADPMRNSERVDLLRSRFEMHEAIKILPVPLTIFTRGLPDPTSSIWPSVQLQEIEGKLQEETLAISSFPSRRIVATASGHFIHRDQPELIIAAIGEVIKTTRTL